MTPTPDSAIAQVYAQQVSHYMRVDAWLNNNLYRLFGLTPEDPFEYSEWWVDSNKLTVIMNDGADKTFTVSEIAVVMAQQLIDESNAEGDVLCEHEEAHIHKFHDVYKDNDRHGVRCMGCELCEWDR